MEKKLDYRSWDELLPEMLGLIFKRLGLHEKLDVVPRVCKAWAKAIKIPDCWQEIDDIQKWNMFWSDDTLDRMLKLLIGRSCGSLQKLSVYGVNTAFGLSLISDKYSSEAQLIRKRKEIFAHLTSSDRPLEKPFLFANPTLSLISFSNNVIIKSDSTLRVGANNLRSLELPESEISNCMVEQMAEKLSNLTYLDLSYCLNIGAPAIEAIGKHCKKLTHFKRNMDPSDVTLEKYEDAEALAIAATMPQLKHLELVNINVTTQGVLRILTNCIELEVLDVRGCRNVKLDDEVLKKHSKLNVMGPNVHVETDFPNLFHFVQSEMV